MLDFEIEKKTFEEEFMSTVVPEGKEKKFKQEDEKLRGKLGDSIDHQIDRIDTLTKLLIWSKQMVADI